METILDRIQQIAASEGIKIGTMEKVIGASKGVLSRAINNRTDIQSKWIQIIVENYPHYSAEWLLTGRGEMQKANQIGGNTPLDQQKETKDTTDIEENDMPIAPATMPGEGIPLIPFEAMAGALTSEQSVLEYECERYVVPAFSGADFLMPVKGDSMLPTYKSGDLVACKRVPTSEHFFQWNKAYVVDTNQGPLIKRIKPAEEGYLYLISDNEDYDPIHIPASAIYAVALVIGVIRLE